jgi:hypothetical protein
VIIKEATIEDVEVPTSLHPLQFSVLELNVGFRFCSEDCLSNDRIGVGCFLPAQVCSNQQYLTKSLCRALI